LKIWRHVSEFDSYFSVMGEQNYFFTNLQDKIS